MLPDLASAAFLTVVLAAALFGMIAATIRSRLSAAQFFFWVLARLLTQQLWRPTTSGPLPLPPRQGAVLVCNHRSSVDPFFIQTLTTRKTHWMVAREYCQHPAFAWFLRLCEVIPVGRGGIDTAATRMAIRLASSGEIVGMLPEGRINMTEQFLLPGRPGAALVALKARVPILPCYLEGSPYDRVPWSPFFMAARVRVHFGPPIELSEFYGREHEEGVLQEVLRRAMRAIAILGERPDFEPQLAGKHWKPTREDLETDILERRRRRRSQPASDTSRMP